MRVTIGPGSAAGRYDAGSPRVLNRRSTGGIYWYKAGWNVQALLARACGSVIGLLSVNTPVHSGPPPRYTGGIDISFLLTAAVTAVVHLLLSARRPHPLPAGEAAEGVRPTWARPRE